MPPATVIGRPRSESVRRAILAAAFELLAELGYGSFTIEGVAARSGTAKTTIYRWWRSKAELAVDAFLHESEAELHLPDSGRTEHDFRAQITELAAWLRGGRGRVLAALLAGSAASPTLSRTIGERLLDPRRASGLERMLRARDAGELRGDVEPTAALSVLYGPLWAPLLFGGDVPSAEEVVAYLNIACDGIFAGR